MSKITLPPLPDYDEDLQGKEIAPGVYQRGYTDAQMQERDRQIAEQVVRACAEAAASVGRPVGASDGSTRIPGTSADAARAILALLPVKDQS